MRSEKVNRAGGRRRIQRVFGWLFMGSLLVLMLAPLPGVFLGDSAVAQTDAEQTNERANFWREVRKGTTGYSAVSGQESNVLIQGGGENWRALKEGPIATYSAWLIALVLLAAFTFHLINGRQKIENGRSGYVIERWKMYERVIHWYVAILFIILALTGLSLMYGRGVMIPMLGKDGFAAYASVAKLAHNYIGPFYAVGMIAMILMWIKDNLPIKADLEWAKSAGGMWGEGHPPADKANAGEKLMFWQFALVGLVIIASGLILDFPNFGQTREIMQWAHVIHVVAAIISTVTLFGHIYMALFGVEGAMEGMRNGHVDTNWAQQHHDIWYQKLLNKGVRPVEAVDEPEKAPVQAEPRTT